MKTTQYDSPVGAAISKASAGARHAADKTARASQHAKHSLKDTSQQILEAEKKWAHASDRYAHRNPWMVAGVAFAAGVAVCSLIRHFKSDSESEY